MMEFEEIQKIWSEERGETMYAIDEKALYRNISKKKNAASRRINIVELCLMAINSAVGFFLLTDAYLGREGFWDYSSGAIMLMTVLFLIIFRVRRKRKENMFDRSMLGELDHAIANSHSILQIATMMIYYYLIPVGIISMGKMLYLGASMEKWLLIIGLYILAFSLIYWERKAFHIPRKKNLEKLRTKLLEA